MGGKRTDPLYFLLRKALASTALDPVSQKHWVAQIRLCLSQDIPMSQRLLVSAALFSYGEVLRLQAVLENSEPHSQAYKSATWSYSRHLENAKKAYMRAATPTYASQPKKRIRRGEKRPAEVDLDIGTMEESYGRTP